MLLCGCDLRPYMVRRAGPIFLAPGDANFSGRRADGWFTDVPNSPQQDDFGYNPSTFPAPAVQLSEYHSQLNVSTLSSLACNELSNRAFHICKPRNALMVRQVKFGGIRKPRIANASMLQLCVPSLALAPTP